MPENPRIEELRRRVQADPASIAFAALAEEYRRQGRFEEAIEACLAGLQRHPAYLSARVTLGRALLETGDLAAAREQFQTVLHSAPENIAATRGLAQIHERLGDSSEMDPHLAQLMREHAEAAAAAPPPQPPPPPEPIRFEPRTLNPAPAPSKLHDLTAELDTLDLHDLDLTLDLSPLTPPSLADAPFVELRTEPEPDPQAQTEPDPEPEAEPELAAQAQSSDVADIASLSNLQRFLAAIQHARHAA
jgi:tetratricopeptide (TPR) repeat protein